MTPKRQTTARDLASPNPSKATRKLFDKILAAAKKDQDELIEQARKSNS